MQHAFQLIDHAERVVQGEQLQISGKIKLSALRLIGTIVYPLIRKISFEISGHSN